MRPEATAASSTTDADRRLIERMSGEYVEMPGLSLTIEQGCRLWGFDPTTCRRLAGVLIEQGVLRWSHGNRLVRPSQGRARA